MRGVSRCIQEKGVCGLKADPWSGMAGPYAARQKQLLFQLGCGGRSVIWLFRHLGQGMASFRAEEVFVDFVVDYDCG